MTEQTRKLITKESLPDGRWRRARKTQICGAEQITDAPVTIRTIWGAELTGKVGDYIVWDELNTADQWIVAGAVFTSTYLQFEPRRFEKISTTEVQEIAEPVSVESAEGTTDGEAGDYLARGSGGEIWLIPGGFFRKAYQFIE